MPCIPKMMSDPALSTNMMALLNLSLLFSAKRWSAKSSKLSTNHGRSYKLSSVYLNKS